MADLRFSFLCGIRGYHEYRVRWVPALNEVSSTKREIHNRHDCYAIAVMKRLPGSLSDSVVGHLPREISRYTYYIILLFMVQACPAKLLMCIIDNHRLCKGA